MLDEKTRVYKDIVMFRDNLPIIDTMALTPAQKKIIELATQYYSDAKYYHDKEEEFTAFGCINYAHGLLDAIIKS